MNPGTFQGAGNGIVQQYGLRRQIAFGASRNYQILYSGWYLIHCIGAGGSGAAQTAVAGNTSRASGGGAGGLAIKRAFLAAGSILNITIGAGGAGKTSGLNGAAGGASSVYGGGVSLYAGGGSGGTYAFNTDGTSSGGAGGSASGGDWNYTGGAGGDAVVTNTAGGQGGWAYGGGGAVSMLGIAYAGGKSTVDGGVGGYCYGGGAGIGGKGGDATTTTGAATCGGNGTIWTAGNNATNGNATAASPNIEYTPFSSRGNLVNVSDFLIFVGSGNIGNASTFYGYGVGSVGSQGFGGPAVLGGSGAGQSGSGNAYAGGGSGAGTASTGNAGDGLVILTWVQQ